MFAYVSYTIVIIISSLTLHVLHRRRDGGAILNLATLSTSPQMTTFRQMTKFEGGVRPQMTNFCMEDLVIYGAADDHPRCL